MAQKAKLNDGQKEAFKALQKFIDHPAADTFVLKGYAGTGKTFLMQYLAGWLDENDHKFSLLASTGRAATVLKGKTGLTAKTVHSELYQFNKVDGADDDSPDDMPIDQHGQLTLLFSLRQPDDNKRIYIVDESSMLSTEMQLDSGMVAFGSGNLLSDFFEAVKHNKIIFVGDPGQLPPVKELFSPALDLAWLAQQQRTAIAITLEKIERVDAGNDILVLASMIRDMALDENLPSFPKLPASKLNNVTIHKDDRSLFRAYVDTFKETGADGVIAIARSNRMVNNINRAMRRELYGSLDLPLQDNDILLVVTNNNAFPLTNGDFVSALKIDYTETQAGLHFQRIEIKTLLSATTFELFISLDILYSTETNFTRHQQKSLMVDFNRRMRRKGIKANSADYKDQMKTDPYLNCLRAKYGYAVTCHKAQGGEWDDVYLFLEKSMYGMPRPELFRWWYTAVTRAKKCLHLANNWWIE